MGSTHSNQMLEYRFKVFEFSIMERIYTLCALSNMSIVFALILVLRDSQGISISSPTMPLLLRDEGISPQIYHLMSMFSHCQVPLLEMTFYLSKGSKLLSFKIQ